MSPHQIREVRRKLGWTQVQMATYLSVSDVMIWRWETAQSTPDTYRMAVLEQLRRRLAEAEAQKRQKAFVKDLQLAGAAGVIALFVYLFSK